MQKSKKEDIVFDDNAPVSIVRVANGFKIIPAKEPHLYHPDHSYTIPNEEYVFSTLQGAFEFLTTHFSEE